MKRPGDDGRRTYEEVAKLFGVTRAAVCQYLVLLQRLPADAVKTIEAQTDVDRLQTLSLKKLVRIARLRQPEQRLEALASLGFH